MVSAIAAMRQILWLVAGFMKRDQASHQPLHVVVIGLGHGVHAFAQTCRRRGGRPAELVLAVSAGIPMLR
jgi:hypothetical protein